MSENKLIVGLGNPGPKYERNWHNLGWLALEILAQRHQLAMRRIRFQGYTDSYTLAGQKIHLLKPTTYMNNSGESVRAALDFYKLSPADVIVIYDDIDLEFGTLRLRDRGSAAHHNGIKSIIQHLGSERFQRVRIGFGPQDRSRDLVAQVLANIPKEREKDCFKLLWQAGEAAELIATAGIGLAQSRCNGNILNPPSKDGAKAPTEPPAKSHIQPEAPGPQPEREVPDVR